MTMHMRCSGVMSIKRCRTGEHQPEHNSIRATVEVWGRHILRDAVFAVHFMQIMQFRQLMKFSSCSAVQAV